eukprot:s415_g11.t2
MHKFRISVMLKTITRVMMTGTDLQSFQHPPCRSLRPAWKTRSYTSSSFTAKKHIVLAFDAGLGILPICVQLRQDTRARSHRIHGKALSVLKRSAEHAKVTLCCMLLTEATNDEVFTHAVDAQMTVPHKLISVAVLPNPPDPTELR